VVICLERGADLHMAQLMTLPVTVSCSSKIHIGFTFLVPAYLGSPGKRAIKRVCVCVCVCSCVCVCQSYFISGSRLMVARVVLAMDSNAARLVCRRYLLFAGTATTTHE